MVNGRELEVVAEFDTVMVAVPGNAVSAAVIVALSCVEFTKAVALGEPFQFTTSPFAKPVPFTVRVRPNGLQYALRAKKLSTRKGMRSSAQTIGNATAPEAPPPPPDVRLNTVTWAVPAEATSAAVIAAVNCVAPTYVVARLAPFHCTTEQGTKLLPVTLRLNAPVPTVALAGRSAAIAGIGSAELGADVVKGSVFEFTVRLETDTDAVPGNAESAALMIAVSCVGLTNVVRRGEPSNSLLNYSRNLCRSQSA